MEGERESGVFAGLWLFGADGTLGTVAGRRGGEAEVAGTGDNERRRTRRARAVRRAQLALLVLVVLLVGARVWEREQGGDSDSTMSGPMAASALSIGVLERCRGRLTKDSR